MNEDPTVTIATFLMIGGAIGAVTLLLVSWPAALMCLAVAFVGRVIMVRRRPTSRWARGWTAFRHQKPPNDRH